MKEVFFFFFCLLDFLSPSSFFFEDVSFDTIDDMNSHREGMIKCFDVSNTHPSFIRIGPLK